MSTGGGAFEVQWQMRKVPGCVSLQVLAPSPLLSWNARQSTQSGIGNPVAASFAALALQHV